MFQEDINKSTKAVENVAEVPSVAYTSINNLFESVVGYLPKIMAGIFVLFIFWAFGKILKHIFLKTSERAKLAPRLRVLISRLLAGIVFLFGTFTALTVIIPKFDFGDLIAGLGFTSFIIGFATKDILNNFLSGILVLWHEPFKIGDYVSVKSNRGEVEHIGIRATQLRMYDGERVLIPNGEMYSSTLIIRGAGTKRRMKLKISTSYKANIEETKATIQKVLFEAEGVDDNPKPSVYVTDLASDGVNLSIYFWINTDENSPMGVFDDIASNIKGALNKLGIILYTPTLAVLKEKDILPDKN